MPATLGTTATEDTSHIYDDSIHDHQPATNNNMGYSFGGVFHSAHKDKPAIDIILDAPYLTLKGTGPDVEPTTLRGNVMLYLTEPTSIKEITLQFRGKARIPVPSTESLINNATSLIYTICNHSWSFLEGTPQRHSRTLKAGRHFFPFHLEIGGCLPSSLSTPLLGGASIAYKLRAHAARPLLSHNLQHITPVTILRSFAHEALEYQQTLEIENTWPDKLMYSIVLPHKAWAMGDRIAALVKFSPLVKGVTVQSVVTNIIEHTRVFARSGSQEDTRVVGSARHDIVDGRAVLVELDTDLVIGAPGVSQAEERTSTAGSNPVNGNTNTNSTPGTPLTSELEDESTHTNDPPSPSPTDTITTISFPLPSSAPSPSSHNNNKVLPSHGLEPIEISHRIRWSIFIRNPDGHLSELRCSLPIIVLDWRLLDEARGFTSATRRLVLGQAYSHNPDDMYNSDSFNDNSYNEDVDGGDQRNLPTDLADRELPSYTAHVRDRVANMYLPEAATMRVTNPWVVRGTLPTSPMTPASGGGGGWMTTPEGVGIEQLMEGGERDTYFSAVQGGTNGIQSVSSSSSVSSLAGGGVNGSGGASPGSRNGSRGGSRPGSRLGMLSVPASLTPANGNANANVHANTGSTSAPQNQTQGQHSQRGVGSRGASGRATPNTSISYNANANVDMNYQHLPHAPGSGQSTPLDWVNSELLLSLSEDPARRFGVGVGAGEVGVGNVPYNRSRAQSRAQSRVQSRVQSRAGSPERLTGGGVSSLAHSGVGGSGSSEGGGDHASTSTGGGVHGVAKLGGLLKGAMKGFTSLGHYHYHHHNQQQQQGQRRTSWYAPVDGTQSVPVGSQAPVSGLSSSPSPPSGSGEPQGHATTHTAGLASSPSPSSTAPLSPSAAGHLGHSHTGPTTGASAGMASRPILPTSMSAFSSSPAHYYSNSSPNSHRNSLAPLSSPPIASSSTSVVTTTTTTGPDLLHRAFTEVPDYAIAARGFIGGVPPLESMRGLPSYEEAARAGDREREERVRRRSVMSEGDLRGGTFRGLGESESPEGAGEEGEGSEGEDGGIEMKVGKRKSVLAKK